MQPLQTQFSVFVSAVGYYSPICSAKTLLLFAHKKRSILRLPHDVFNVKSVDRTFHAFLGLVWCYDSPVQGCATAEVFSWGDPFRVFAATVALSTHETLRRLLLYVDCMVPHDSTAHVAYSQQELLSCTNRLCVQPISAAGMFPIIHETTS